MKTNLANEMWLASHAPAALALSRSRPSQTLDFLRSPAISCLCHPFTLPAHCEPCECSFHPRLSAVSTYYRFSPRSSNLPVVPPIGLLIPGEFHASFHQSFASRLKSPRLSIPTPYRSFHPRLSRLSTFYRFSLRTQKFQCNRPASLNWPPAKERRACSQFHLRPRTLWAKLGASVPGGEQEFLFPFFVPGCALSSAVEHYLHTVGVAGSNPAARTILPSRKPKFAREPRTSPLGFEGRLELDRPKASR